MSSPEVNDINQSTEKLTSYYSGMNVVFEHIKKIINAMNEGDRITLEDLKDKISATVDGMSRTKIGGLIKLFCAQNKEVIVESGAGGGIFKGGRKKRVDMRRRCPTCTQVLRTDFTKSKLTSPIQEPPQPTL